MNRLTELRNLVDQHDQIYYNGGANPVDDATYDGWKRELRELDPTDTRLTRVGAPVDGTATGSKVSHSIPMDSLDNAMNEDELRKWYATLCEAWSRMPGALLDKMPQPLLNASFKMDGGSGALNYVNGHLQVGATRGDGLEGEDITANVLRMAGVPAYVETPGLPEPKYEAGVRPKGMRIAKPFTGSIRGEMMLPHREWAIVDPQKESNPRNLGNGISRRSDGEQCEHLHFVAFRGYDGAGRLLEPFENDMLGVLRQMGFIVVPSAENLTIDQVIETYRHMQGIPPAPNQVGRFFSSLLERGGSLPKRDALPFDIDGIVVKAESLRLQEFMGSTSHHPRAQIALKFPPMGAVTMLKSIEWTIGHTGGIYPTANLEPVKVGGVTVSRALLCNMDEIGRLDVAIGDMVMVCRQGDVIPKVTSVVTRPANRRIIQQPACCPCCSGPIDRRKGVDGEDSVVIYCLNENCPAKALGKLTTWIKKLDIQGLGDVYIEALFAQGVVHEPADLYTLTNRYKAFVNCVVSDSGQILGESRADKILDEIDKKRQLTVSQFIGSLGIDGLGRRRVVLVQEAQPGEFDQLGDWTSGKLVKMAAAVGLPRIAASIQTQLDSKAKQIHALLAAGVTLKDEDKKPMAKPSNQKVDAKRILLTGKFPEVKSFYGDRITAAGHIYVTEYKSGQVDILCTAAPDVLTGKTKKAHKDGILIIDERGLLAGLSNGF